MPSDELRQRALEALRERREAFHSAVATAVDEVRALLDAQRVPANGKAARAASELGAFATGRIDVERFASLFAAEERLDAGALEQVEQALATLTELLEAGDDLYVARVPAGGDLRDTVRAALARSGRAFAAGRAVENARSGGRPGEYADGFDPARWNRAERTVAPPLVVELEGADLRPAGLADYLEGGQVIVLLVRKPSPPAALARLIAPGVLVSQGADAAALERLKGWDGPAVVAVVPEGAAVFGYVPSDEGPGELKVERRPEEAPKSLGGLSAARQQSELALLDLLDGAAAGRVVAAAGAAAGPAADPADKLAAWLLRQATVPGPGEA